MNSYMTVYLILVKDELTNIQIMAQNKKLGNSIWIRAAETKVGKNGKLAPKKLEFKGEQKYA